MTVKAAQKSKRALFLLSTSAAAAPYPQSEDSC